MITLRLSDICTSVWFVISCDLYPEIVHMTHITCSRHPAEITTPLLLRVHHAGNVTTNQSKSLSESVYVFMSRLDVFLSAGDANMSHVSTETVRHVLSVTGVSKNTTIDK